MNNKNILKKNPTKEFFFILKEKEVLLKQMVSTGIVFKTKQEAIAYINKPENRGCKFKSVYIQYRPLTEQYAWPKDIQDMAKKI